jgi:hypothetical protein
MTYEVGYDLDIEEFTFFSDTLGGLGGFKGGFVGGVLDGAYAAGPATVILSGTFHVDIGRPTTDETFGTTYTATGSNGAYSNTEVTG